MSENTGVSVAYCRVSTEGQNLDRQLEMMRQLGIAEKNIFCEKISGKKISTSRDKFNELMRFLRRGDTLYVESLSRIGRNSRDILNVLEKLNEMGVEFKSLKEQFDFSSTTGKFVLTTMAAIAQLERDIIRDRTMEGLEAARLKGHVGGRKPVAKAKVDKVLQYYNSGEYTVKECCVLAKVSLATLYRELRKLKTEPAAKELSYMDDVTKFSV